MQSNQHWLSWYKEQLPHAAKASKQLRSGLKGMIIVLLVLPTLVAGLLVFIIQSESEAESIPLLVALAFMSAAVYAASDVLALRLLRLDRLDVSWLPVRMALFQVLSVVSYWAVVIAQNAIGLSLPDPFDATSDRPIEGFASLFFIAIQVALSRGLLVAYLQRRYGATVLSFDKPQLLQIPTGSSAVCGMVDDILIRCRELGLPELRLSLWLLRSDRTLLPSLFAVSQNEKTEYRMVIPRPFLELVVSKHRGRALAILAHEISHAFQNDVELWSRSDLFYSVFARTLVPQLVPTAAVSLVVALAALAAGRLGLVGGAAVMARFVIDMVRAQTKVRNARKTSEHIADVFASYLTSVESLSQSIKEYATDKSRLHPSSAERIEYLATMRAQLDSDPIAL